MIPSGCRSDLEVTTEVSDLIDVAGALATLSHPDFAGLPVTDAARESAVEAWRNEETFMAGDDLYGVSNREPRCVCRLAFEMDSLQHP